MIKLGQRVRDTITGFEGIATAKVEYLNGCVQFCIKPKITKDGKISEGEYIDVGQLEVIKGEVKVDPKSIGGEMQDKPKANYSG